MLCNTVVQGTKQEIEAIIKLAEEELRGECYEVIEYKNLTVARLLFSDEPKEIIEENARLIYVGITRGKKKLYLSCAKNYKFYKDEQIPSGFLEGLL